MSEIITHYLNSHRDELIRRFKKMGAPESDAEDLFQIVAEKTLKAKNIKSETLGNFINTIATNSFKDHARKHLRHGGHDLELPDDNSLNPLVSNEPSVESQVLKKITNQQLISELEQLSNPRDRDILTYFAQGFSSDEIANILHMNSATVRTRQRRALNELRKKFSKSE